MPEKQSTLGIQIDLALLETVTPDSVYVYLANKDIANRFIDIINRFLRLWVDDRLINLPPD